MRMSDVDLGGEGEMDQILYTFLGGSDLYPVINFCPLIDLYPLIGENTLASVTPVTAYFIFYFVWI